MEDKVSLSKTLSNIQSYLEENKEKPIKKRIKIPNKAKVRRGKIKKGWVGILKVDENGHISGEKQKIEGSSFQLKDGTYHATDGREILFWEGKYPVIVQETKSENPVIFNKGENKTYGQKYIKAKLLKDVIVTKKKGGSIIIWIILIGAALFAVNYFFGK